MKASPGYDNDSTSMARFTDAEECNAILYQGIHLSKQMAHSSRPLRTSIKRHPTNRHPPLRIPLHPHRPQDIVEPHPQRHHSPPHHPRDLAQRPHPQAQRLDGDPDGPGEGLFQERRREELIPGAVGPALLEEDGFPLLVAEAGVSVELEGEDEVVELLLPGGGRAPGGGLVVCRGQWASWA